MQTENGISDIKSHDQTLVQLCRCKHHNTQQL